MLYGVGYMPRDHPSCMVFKISDARRQRTYAGVTQHEVIFYTSELDRQLKLHFDDKQEICTPYQG